MSKIKKLDNLFCGDEMLDKYEKEECQTVYEKSSSLEVSKISNGIVHPLQDSETSVGESKQFGGVTDENFNFIELSLNKRVNPPSLQYVFNDWYEGANPKYRHSDIDYVEEEVVFIGALSKHYGWFILEGLARLWFYLEPGNKKYKCVYISGDGEDRFNECFKLFGIEEKNIMKITKPTKFRTVIVPEQSIRSNDFYHMKYKETIDKVKENVNPSEYKKVYFSKAGIRNNRAIGEAPIQEVFLNNNFNVFHPENLNMYDTISILKGCEVFAATSGTNIHNSVFMNDGNTTICLNRSAHFHPLQTMIERMRNLASVYVDVFIFSSLRNFGDAPCLLAPTRFLFNFFREYNFHFNRFNHYLKTPLYFLNLLTAELSRDQKKLWLDQKMKTSNWKIIRIGGKVMSRFYFWLTSR